MDLKIGSLEDGTAIGSGLATAVNRLRRAPDKSKVVLLLTDGENNKGLIDPRTAAATAAAYGIRVYTIGVGTIGEAPIPTGRGLGGFRYELLPVRIDEPLLREIAAKTGGRYFRARDSEALSRIFHQIDQLEKTPIQVTRYTKYEEATRPLVAARVSPPWRSSCCSAARSWCACRDASTRRCCCSSRRSSAWRSASPPGLAGGAASGWRGGGRPRWAGWRARAAAGRRS